MKIIGSRNGQVLMADREFDSRGTYLGKRGLIGKSGRRPIHPEVVNRGNGIYEIVDTRRVETVTVHVADVLGHQDLVVLRDEVARSTR